MSTEHLTRRIRRNMVLDGSRTSVSLEVAAWNGLSEICRREAVSLDELCQKIVSNGNAGSRASALRVYVMNYFMSRALHLEDNQHFDRRVAQHG